jgi:probable HAF family extracellular repeat protein
MKLRGGCKTRMFGNVIKLVLFAAAMGLPACVLAQSNSSQELTAKHQHYQPMDLGTLGGPNTYLSGPFTQILNNQGTVAAYANTATPNPNANCAIPFNANNGQGDCYVERPVFWHGSTLTELDLLPGGTNGQTSAISANGLIAGWSENGLLDSTGLPVGRPVLWTKDGRIIDLGTVPGGTEGLSTFVNSRGEVVGFSDNDVADAFSMVGFPTQTRAFFWQSGTLRDLGTLGGPDALASNLNERGQIAGVSYTNSTPNLTTGFPTQDPFLWENGKMTDLGTLGGTQGITYWLNNRGDVVGSSNLSGDMAADAFLWTRSGGMQDLGNLGGTGAASVWVNNARQVVGTSLIPNDLAWHAFLWRDGVMNDLGTLGSDPSSEAQSINEQGQVVGVSFDGPNDLHGFLWEKSGPIADLNTLVPPGSSVTIINAFQINDRGEIAAKGVLSTGEGRAVLLIPCDENHPGIEGCDYEMEEARSEAPGSAGAAALTPLNTMAQSRSQMEGRNRRFGRTETSRK